MLSIGRRVLGNGPQMLWHTEKVQQTLRTKTMSFRETLKAFIIWLFQRKGSEEPAPLEGVFEEKGDTIDSIFGANIIIRDPCSKALICLGSPYIACKFPCLRTRERGH